MRKVEHYICEVCGTEYADKLAAEKCEKAHKQVFNIKSLRFLPVTQDKTGLPTAITIKYADGKQLKTATYKR